MAEILVRRSPSCRLAEIDSEFAIMIALLAFAMVTACASTPARLIANAQADFDTYLS
jgi:hypothetical protein